MFPLTWNSAQMFYIEKHIVEGNRGDFRAELEENSMVQCDTLTITKL